jgi:hypothetical protein
MLSYLPKIHYQGYNLYDQKTNLYGLPTGFSSANGLTGVLIASILKSTSLSK